MNGDIGVIHEISKMPDPDDMNRWTYIASIEFNGDGKRHDYTPEMMQDLTLLTAQPCIKAKAQSTKPSSWWYPRNTKLCSSAISSIRA